ncbi:MAG: hypothetical protein ACE5I3_10820 [Phycisphaerae bacterium]
MKAHKFLRRAARLSPLSGLLLANGCLATLERNIDYLLAPDALENTLFIPFSDVAPLAQFLLRLLT